jgi:hypothetical protein
VLLVVGYRWIEEGRGARVASLWGVGWRRGLAEDVGLVLVVWVALSWTGARDGLVMEVWGVVGVEGGMGRGVGRGRGVASAHADPAMRGKGMLGVGAGIGSSAKCVKVFL